ncbi:MAG: UDP-N-acetylmuramoyl-L-alanine--D-glutamate ligase [Planctomycetota bacterium]
MSEVTELRGRRVVVLGLGRFGGGVGVTRFACARGAASVMVVDEGDPGTLDDAVAQLAGLEPVELVLGPDAADPALLEEADLLVVNPAVKPGHPLLDAAGSRGVPVTTEINLLVERLDRARVIGVTGTAGKSTTASLIAHLLNAAGRVAHLGGNLGGSLLGRVDGIGPEDWVVLELSSFMLDRLDAIAWSPRIAVVTTFAPNHLDWHGDEEAYRAAKQVLLDHQSLVAGDVCVLGPSAAEAFRPFVPQVMIDRRRLDVSGLCLPGEHNRENAGLAVRAVAAAGVDPAEACRHLASFTGLPHRLQLVADVGGVRWFNDSKATTPEAAMLALRAFPHGTTHLICGGADKGANLMPLGALAAAVCRAVYTIGDTGDRLAAAAQLAAGSGDPPRQVDVVRCGDLDTAVEEVKARVHIGDAVLLSPGCASWDQFANYERRGERYVALCPRA